jgi:glycopeptide antibiotics resistance protein
MIWTISFALRNFINPYIVLPGILVLVIVLWKRRDQYNLVNRVFFSLFWLYLLILVSMTVFSGTVYRSVPWAERLQMMPELLARVNLIPFQFGDFPDPGYIWPDVLLNIGVTVPFGFGVAFFTGIRLRKMILLAVGLGLFFEVGQLAVTLLTASPNRAPDVNDVIFNAMGALIGYGLFRLFHSWRCGSVMKSWTII